MNKKLKNVRFKNAKLISFILILVMVSTSLSFGSGGYNISPTPEALRGDENGLAWMSYVSNSWDIFYLNFSDGKVTQITNEPSTQGYPDIWQNYIVWQDNRDRVDGGFDIYVYDLTTGVEKNISNLGGNHQNPLVANNQVVWINEINGKRLVMAYDLFSETTQVISSDMAEAYGLDFDGNTVVWMDGRSGIFNIFMASPSTGVEKQITFGLQNAVDPLVSDGKILWRINHNGVDHVYMYEEATSYTSRLTAGFENHRPLAFSREGLIMLKGEELIYSNVDAIVEYPIKTTSENIPDEVILNGDRVIWFDGGRIFSETVNTALDRAIEKESELELVPDPNNPMPSPEMDLDTPEIQEDENRKLIKANQENTLAFDEGRVIFNIPEGAFFEDTYLNFSVEEKYSAEGYVSITDTYRWGFEGGTPLLPIEVIVRYDKDELRDNPKKICGYDLTGEAKLVFMERNYEEGIFSYTIQGDAALALMIFNKEFNDLANHWSYDVVEVITSHQMISGYDDGSFRPNQSMTRTEFIKVLVSGLYLEMEEGSQQVFIDVPVDFWGNPYIATAKEKGWIVGDEGKFNPNSTITRQEMITILMRVYENLAIEEFSFEEISLSQRFRDYEKVSGWALDSMEKAVAMGLIGGDNNLLNPTGKATRAEAATILYRYLEMLNRL